MLTITLTKDHNVISEIVCDKKIWALQNGQDPTEDQQHYVPNIQNEYLVVKHGFHLVGLFVLKKITHKLYDAHIRILPSYWGSDMSIKATHLMFDWVIAHSEALSIMTMVPANCDHVKRFLDKLGAKVSGLIKDGIVYDHELVDLIIYTKQIKEE